MKRRPEPDYRAEALAWTSPGDRAVVMALLAIADAVDNLTEELSWLDEGTATRGTAQYSEGGTDAA